MATAIETLRKVQIGRESTKGTLVAATKQLVGRADLREEQDFYRSEMPIGIRGNVGGAGVITRAGSMIDFESELTAEEILWFLLTGVQGQVTPTGTDDYTWVFEPDLVAADIDIDTATVEVVESDGTTNHVASEVGYAMTSSLRIEWTPTGQVDFNASMFGRKRQASTPTGALTPYATREVLIGAASSHFLDTTAYADVGDTQLSGIVLGGSLEIQTGLRGRHTADARADKDFSGHRVGKTFIDLSMTVELDAVGAARLGNYRSNDIVYVRNKFAGSVVDSLPRMVQVDGAYRFKDFPSLGTDEEQRTITLNLESVYDPTSGKTYEVTVVNGLATI